MRNPIEQTISMQSLIIKADITQNPDLLTPFVWSAFYEELYSPLTEKFDSNDVFNQFIRDQYLIRKAIRKSQLLTIKMQIHSMNTTLDTQAFWKNRSVLSDEELTSYNIRLFTSTLDETMFTRDLQKCWDILSSKPKSMMVYDRQGFLPLHYAALSGNFELLKLIGHWAQLVKCVINAESNTANKSTPLHCAVLANEADSVSYLLVIGANVNMARTNGETALHLATWSLEIVKILAAQGAILDAKDNRGYTPLQVAVEADHIQTAQFLFEMGADIKLKTKDGKSVFDLIPEDNEASFQFLHDKREIDKTREEALLCFKHVASIRTYPQESMEDLQAMSQALESFSKANIAQPKINIAGSFFYCAEPVVITPENSDELPEDFINNYLQP